MEEFRKDISELIKLKFDFEFALDNNDLDMAGEILEKIKKIYKTITGEEFEKGISDKNILQIKSLTNIDGSQNNVKFEDLELEM